MKNKKQTHKIVGILDYASPKVIALRYNKYATMRFFGDKKTEFQNVDEESLPLGETYKAEFTITKNGPELINLSEVNPDEPIQSNITVTGLIKTVLADNVEKKYQYRVELDNGVVLPITDLYTGFPLQDMKTYTLELSIRGTSIRGFNGRLIENTKAYTNAAGQTFIEKYKKGYVYNIQRIVDESGLELFRSQYAVGRIEDAYYDQNS